MDSKDSCSDSRGYNNEPFNCISVDQRAYDMISAANNSFYSSSNYTNVPPTENKSKQPKPQKKTDVSQHEDCAYFYLIKQVTQGLVSIFKATDTLIISKADN
ncbi:unnamed protein product [Adineta ricciae]|uniref:Uncharacterized protein n=1 Tax=Adineta ricciae TaxID=249248 RepID=A0A814U6A9_ADIRI|nr:unnamed protein product [Adineta ricciae]